MSATVAASHALGLLTAPKIATTAAAKYIATQRQISTSLYCSAAAKRKRAAISPWANRRASRMREAFSYQRSAFSQGKTGRGAVLEIKWEGLYAPTVAGLVAVGA